jgi:hypothetical protein
MYDYAKKRDTSFEFEALLSSSQQD